MHRNRLGKIILWISLSVLLSACFKNEEPGTPAYIRVESILLNTSVGTNSSNITDAWVSVDGQAIGAGTFPAEFPVIINETFDSNSIRIQAGIKKNGITNTRAVYPFYNPVVVLRDLQPGQTVPINVVMDYDPAAKIIEVENFENPNQPTFTEDLDDNPNTGMRYQTTDVFEGTGSGQIYLDSANLECIVGTSQRFAGLVGVSATPVYLEMNFKTNTPVQVGLQAHRPFGTPETIFKGGLNVTETWRKIYFEFTNEVFGTSPAQYSVIFRAVRVDGTEPEIYIDNVQLLHF